MTPRKLSPTLKQRHLPALAEARAYLDSAAWSLDQAYQALDRTDSLAVGHALDRLDDSQQLTADALETLQDLDRETRRILLSK